MAPLAATEPGVSDSVMLDNYSSEDALVENLRVRFAANYIYTYIGSVVISVNPYKALNLYTDERKLAYRQKNQYQESPHVFAIIDAAYRSMKNELIDQVCIISGESGAGKTEASKRIMEYIATATGSSGGSQGDVEKVKSRLLESNPVLESFGNAKTNRNDNSSRFGKYMDILFDFKGDVKGGTILNYLLEKSRVVYQQEGERNFHIFYNVLAGASDEDVAGWELSRDPTKYHYLNQGNSHKLPGIDDKQDYKAVTRAMDILGFSAQEKKEIFECVAGIIHLGEIQIKGDSETSTVTSSVSACARLLGCTEQVIIDSLTSRTVSVGGNDISTPLSGEKAIYTRDAFAKALYDNMFVALVRSLNKSLKFTRECSRVTKIGVLDIYGFEIFGHNGFEQLCINYCNEKLQQLFIELTLKSEQEEYEREGIVWTDIDYFNNKIICEMVDGRQTGIISILDEECIRPGDPTDWTLLEKLNHKFRNHEHYVEHSADRKRITSKQFLIKHFAGDVVYSTQGFIDKNNDLLFKDQKAACKGSSSTMLQQFYTDEQIAAYKRPDSSFTHFKKSVLELMQILMSKRPNYVRCIKPNDTKTAGVFDLERVVHQVRYLGLVENVRVRRAGFAYRQKYEPFLDRYKCLCPQTWPVWNGDAEEGVGLIAEHMNYNQKEETGYVMGRTKIFIRNPGTLFDTEIAFQNRLHYIATVIQKRWRGYAQKQKYQRMRAAVTTIACYVRRHFAKRLAADRRAAIKKVHEFYCGFLERKEPVNPRNAMFVRVRRLRYLQELAKHVPKTCVDKSWFPPPSGLEDVSGLLKKLILCNLRHRYRKNLTPERKQHIEDKISMERICKGKTGLYGRSVPEWYASTRYTPSDTKVQKAWAKATKKTPEDGQWQYGLDGVTFFDGKKEIAATLRLSSAAVFLMSAKKKVLVRVPFSCIKDLTLSSALDGAICLHGKPEDPTFTGDVLVFAPRNQVEVTFHILQAVGNPTVPVAFGTSITQYLRKGKQRQVIVKKGTPHPKKGPVARGPKTDSGVPTFTYLSANH